MKMKGEKKVVLESLIALSLVIGFILFWLVV